MTTAATDLADEVRRYVKFNEIEFRNEVARTALHQALELLERMSGSSPQRLSDKASLEGVRRELLVAMTAAAEAEARAAEAESEVGKLRGQVEELEGKVARRKGGAT